MALVDVYAGLEIFHVSWLFEILLEMNAFPIYGLNHGAAGSAFVLLLTLIFLAKLK